MDRVAEQADRTGQDGKQQLGQTGGSVTGWRLALRDERAVSEIVTVARLGPVGDAVSCCRR